MLHVNFYCSSVLHNNVIRLNAWQILIVVTINNYDWFITILFLFSNISSDSMISPWEMFCSFEIDGPVYQIKQHEW